MWLRGWCVSITAAHQLVQWWLTLCQDQDVAVSVVFLNYSSTSICAVMTNTVSGSRCDCECDVSQLQQHITLCCDDKHCVKIKMWLSVWCFSITSPCAVMTDTVSRSRCGCECAVSQLQQYITLCCDDKHCVRIKMRLWVWCVSIIAAHHLVLWWQTLCQDQNVTVRVVCLNYSKTSPCAVMLDTVSGSRCECECGVSQLQQHITLCRYAWHSVRIKMWLWVWCVSVTAAHQLVLWWLILLSQMFPESERKDNNNLWTAGGSRENMPSNILTWFTSCNCMCVQSPLHYNISRLYLTNILTHSLTHSLTDSMSKFWYWIPS
jgi:hypothetical protein